MGAKQFSDALRVQHIEQYDKLHLQYLDWLLEHQKMNNWLGTPFKPFLPYENQSEDGYGGFVPSGQWLQDVYDSFIEEHRPEFDQHTAMLSAEICAIDHSHKVEFDLNKAPAENLIILTDHKTHFKSQWCPNLLWASDSYK